MDLTAGVPSRAKPGRPTEAQQGGAMATLRKLAGVRGFLVSEHRFKKEKHHRNEELTANSRRCFAGAEERREELAARGGLLGFWSRAAGGSRAWFLR